jgi:hypothetical protein
MFAGSREVSILQKYLDEQISQFNGELEVDERGYVVEDD